MIAFSFDELTACAEREVRFRERVYARRIQRGKMKAAAAEREIALMTAIAAHLRAQAEAVRLAESRQRSLSAGSSVRELRPKSAGEYDLLRLAAAARTLEWLQGHEDPIKAFLALPASSRQAVLLHGNTMAEMCLEHARREAIAEAGGPVR